MKRLAGYFIKAVALVLVAISINFLLVQLMPGDPIVNILGETEYFLLETKYPELLEEARAKYGLDGSLAVQYFRFIRNTLTFEFGTTFSTERSVMDTVLVRMRWTLMLAFSSIVISAIIGGALGIIAGYKKGSKLDGVLTFIFLLLETIPANCLALLALMIFGFKLRWFPLSGMASGGVVGINRIFDTMYHMVLPVFVLSLFRTSSNFLMAKSFTSQIRDEEYVTTALAKGLPRRVFFGRHILKSVLVPYVTLLCMQFGFIFSGSMLIEVVFSWRGMGTLIYSGVMARDYPTVQLCFLVTSVCVVFFHLVADVLAWKFDPRIKDGMIGEV